MSDTPVSWAHCDRCARHVRANEPCPFCARDAKNPAAIAPAAAVIAALAALTPLESSAETREQSPRLAQMADVAAYGAPAPAYGLAPMRPPPDNSRYQVSITNLALPATRRNAPQVRMAIQRSIDAIRACADALPSPLPTNTLLNVQLRIGAQAGTVHQVALSVTPSTSVGTALSRCAQGNLQRISWPRDASATAAVRWSYRFRRVVER